jgi:hypothetical protein
MDCRGVSCCSKLKLKLKLKLFARGVVYVYVCVCVYGGARDVLGGFETCPAISHI